MTTAYNLPQKLYRADAAKRSTLRDTGSGGTVVVAPNALSVLHILTAGARTLQAAAQVAINTQVLVTSSASSATVNGVAIADGGWAVFRVVYDSSDANAWVVTSSSNVTYGTKTESLPIDNQWRVWDALITNLAGADGTDDLGLVTGTFATANPTFNVTVATPSAAPFYARRNWRVPDNYKAGTNLTVSIVATETVAATTAQSDLVAVRQAAPSADICATAAATIVGGATNSFTLTGTDVVPGDILDLRIAIILSDVAATPNYSITAVSIAYTAAP